MNYLTPTNNAIAKQTITEERYNDFIAYLDVKPNSVKTYKTAIKQFFIYLQANGISQPKRADILAFRDEQMETKKPTTVQSYLTGVKLFFQWLEVQGYYPDVTKHIKGAKINRDHKKDYLTPEQVKAILAQMKTDTPTEKRNYAIFLLMLNGGLRDIEVHRANIEDLRALGGQSVLYIQGKGKDEKEDYIKVQPVTERAIRDYLSTRSDADEGEPLFTSASNNSKGGRLSTRTISGIIKRSMEKAGYKSNRLTAHSLRHTAVTLSLLAGNTLQETQAFARHANISTTQIYAHNIDRMESRCELSIMESIL